MQNIFKMEEIMHNQLTESDIKKMQEEIEYRKLVVRKEALEDVKEARAQGDLSENFEYYAAKKFKNKNEGRIRFLERMIKTAEVVSDESAADEVGMNNKVEVWFEEDLVPLPALSVHKSLFFDSAQETAESASLPVDNPPRQRF